MNLKSPCSAGSIFILALLLISHKLNAQPAYLIIPGQKENTVRYGLVIGNENYQLYARKYTTDVLKAIYDSEKFAYMLGKNNLVDKAGLSFYPDATNTHIKLILNKIAKTPRKPGSRTELVFYFNGKISVNSYDEMYLVPVDGAEEDLFFSLPVDELYERIAAAGIDEAWIFIDAVPDGRKKSPGLLESPGIHTGISEPYKPVIHFIKAVEADEKKPQAVDITPPVLIVEEPGQTVRNSTGTWRLKGTVTDHSGVAVLAVNGEEAHLNVDGSFFASLTLTPGENNVMIEAFDNYGNHAEKQITIVFERLEEEQLVTAPPVFYAILVGINHYKDPLIPDLSGPVSDMNKLSKVITELYHFSAENTWLLYNISSSTLYDTLASLKSIIRPEDNLILVYAGHGTWDDQSGIGYWLLSDAVMESRKNWVSNTQITSALSDLNTRHTLVITDACFGGGLFRVRGLPPGADEDILKKYQLRSRNAMTSGDLNEVPDISVFMSQLIEVLVKMPERLITAEQLFHRIKEPVINATDNIPQFGKIKSSGDEGGDFVFMKQ